MLVEFGLVMGGGVPPIVRTAYARRGVGRLMNILLLLLLLTTPICPSRSAQRHQGGRMFPSKPEASFWQPVPHDTNTVVNCNIPFRLRFMLASREVGIGAIAGKFVMLPIRSKYSSRYAVRMVLPVIRKPTVKRSK